MDYTEQIKNLQDAAANVTAINSALDSVMQSHQSLSKALAQAKAQLETAQMALISPSDTVIRNESEQPKI